MKVEYYPEWLKKNEIDYNNRNFLNIIDFYLFKTPIENESSRSISLKNYGWNEKNIIKELEKYMMMNENLVRDKNFKHVSKIDNINKELKSVFTQEEFWKDIEKNKIVMYKSERIITNLLFYIRCGFAHGRFAIYQNKNKEKVYIIENIKRRKVDDNGKYNFLIVARFILKEKTLLKWIELISGGEEKFDKLYLALISDIKDIIKKNIKDNKFVKEQLMNEFVMQDKKICKYNCYVKKAFNELKNSHEIYYDRKDKFWKIQ